jgi:hypothetical protein
LRFRDSEAPEKVEWLHREVEAATGKRLPGREEEMHDPAPADALYDAAVARLREHRRDRKRYPLIFAENCSNGFRRNLFGLRKVGVGIGAAVGLASAVLLPLSSSGWVTITDLGLVLGLSVAIVALALWTWLVTPKWVKEAGDAYAERLLLSADKP